MLFGGNPVLQLKTSSFTAESDYKTLDKFWDMPCSLAQHTNPFWPTRVGHVLCCQTYFLSILSNLMWQWKCLACFILYQLLDDFPNKHRTYINLIYYYYVSQCEYPTDPCWMTTLNREHCDKHWQHITFGGCLYVPMESLLDTKTIFLRNDWRDTNHGKLHKYDAKSKPALHSISWTNG